MKLGNKVIKSRRTLATGKYDRFENKQQNNPHVFDHRRRGAKIFETRSARGSGSTHRKAPLHLTRGT